VTPCHSKPGSECRTFGFITRLQQGSYALIKQVLTAALLSGAALAQADSYTTLALPTLNADIRANAQGAAFAPLFPGTYNWTGVPFQLVTSPAGDTSFLIGVLDIPVGVFGVTTAYTLINSAFGAFGANNGSVEFFGATSYYKMDLIQGVNIRDFYDNVFNNVIDGINAVPAYVDGPGRVRLDQQIYNLPAAFATETLVSMRFTGLDAGQSGQAFITAATVAVASPVPEPGSALLLAMGLAGALMWRQRADARRLGSALTTGCAHSAARPVSIA